MKPGLTVSGSECIYNCLQVPLRSSHAPCWPAHLGLVVWPLPPRARGRQAATRGNRETLVMASTLRHCSGFSRVSHFESLCWFIAPVSGRQQKRIWGSRPKHCMPASLASARLSPGWFFRESCHMKSGIVGSPDPCSTSPLLPIQAFSHKQLPEEFFFQSHAARSLADESSPQSVLCLQGPHTDGGPLLPDRRSESPGSMFLMTRAKSLSCLARRGPT